MSFVAENIPIAMITTVDVAITVNVLLRGAFFIDVVCCCDLNVPVAFELFVCKKVFDVNATLSVGLNVALFEVFDRELSIGVTTLVC